MFEPSATLHASRGSPARAATSIGRDLYDMTNGWGGHPGNEAPIVVLTHQAPDQHPDGVPFYFVSDVEAAIAHARRGRRGPRCRDRRCNGGAAGARRRVARRHRGEPRARSARRGHPVVRRFEGTGATLGPRHPRGARGDAPALRGAEAADSVSMTDLSRYADWTGWLTSQAEADVDARCVWVGGSAATGGYDEWSDLDVDVLCTPGTSTDGLRAAGWRRRTRDFDVRDVWEVPEHVWPDGRQCFVNLQDRPGLLLGADPAHRPARSPTCPTSTRTSTCAGTGRRSSSTTPTGCWCSRRRTSPTRSPRPSPGAPAAGRPTSGWSTGRSAAATSPRRSTSTCGSRWRPWSGWSASSTARGATTSGCATCARTCRRTSRTASRSWSRAPATASLEELSLRCYAWLDELLDQRRRQRLPVPRPARAAVPEHHEPEHREPEQEDREVRDHGDRDQHGQHHQERGRNPAAKRPQARQLQ